MPSVPGTTIVDKISNDDKDLGDAFLKRIAPPFMEASAHKALLKKETAFSQKAQRSFGHRLFSRGATDRFKEAKLLLPHWEGKFLPDFQRWNIDAHAGVQRLQTLDQERVGAILCVARHGITGEPYITVYGGPVVTPFTLAQDRKYFGAPDWGKSFSPEVVDMYLPEGLERTHAVMASAASFSRGDLPHSLSDLEKTIKPVIMTPDSVFGLRLEDADGSGVFATLFLPMYCDPPVGLFVPVTYGYTRFLDLVRGHRPYCAFAKLLEKHEAVFQPWFEAAGTHSDSMAVHVSSALPLWDTFPCTANDGDEARAVRVTSFLYPRNRLAWRYWVDMIVCGPGTDSIDEYARTRFMRYLHRVNGHLPTVMGWEHLPSTDYPFTAFLFPCVDPKVTPWLAIFDFGDDAEDRTTTLVRSVSKVPIDPDSDSISEASDGTHIATSPPPRSVRSNTTSQSNRVDRRNIPDSPDSVFFQQQSHSAGHPVTDDRPGHPAPPSAVGFPGQVITQEDPQPVRRSPRNHRSAAPAAPTGFTSAKRLMDYQDSRAPPSQRRRGELHVPAPPTQATPEDIAASGFGRRLNFGATPPLGTTPAPAPPAATATSFQPPAAHFPPATGTSATLPGATAPAPPAHTPGLPIVAGSYQPPLPPHHSWQGHPALGPTPVSAPLVKPDSLMDATLGRQDKWASCPPVWLHMSLLQLYLLDPHQPVWDAISRQPCVPGNFAFVREPSDLARRRVLAFLEPNSGVEVGSVGGLLALRCTHGTKFSMGRLFTANDFVGLNDKFLRALFNVHNWQVSRSGIVSKDDTRFHVLDFGRVLRPDLPKTHLPSGGYSIGFAQDVARVAYYLLSLIGIEGAGPNELHDDGFHSTAFGQALYKLCCAPFNHQVAEHWNRHQSHATNLWINDFVALFELVASFISMRTGTGPENAIVFLETNSPQRGTFIGTPVHFPARQGERPDTFLDRLQSLSDGFQRWTLRHYHGNEPMWTQPVSEALLAPAPSYTGKPPPRKEVERRQTRGTLQPLTVKKPLFRFVKHCPDDKTPQEVMRDDKIYDWVKMDRLSGDGKRQVCFRCAFESCNTCPDVSKCKPTQRGRSRGGQRLHIDLADSAWATYPKEKWKPMVAFQKRHFQYLQPTDDFKAMVPDADWKTE